MYTIGIDPGPVDYAVVILTPAGNIHKAGRAKTTEDLVSMIEDGNMASVYIEGITSYGQPVGREVFDTCYNIGRILERFPKAKIVSRLAVKKHFGVKRSTKEEKAATADSQIKQALELIFPKEQLKLHAITKDLWQALGIAVFAQKEVPGDVLEDNDQPDEA